VHQIFLEDVSKKKCAKGQYKTIIVEFWESSKRVSLKVLLWGPENESVVRFSIKKISSPSKIWFFDEQLAELAVFVKKSEFAEFS
jgi:hypothetical protein